jgi:hypothetical protein
MSVNTDVAAIQKGIRACSNAQTQISTICSDISNSFSEAKSKNRNKRIDRAAQQAEQAINEMRKAQGEIISVARSLEALVSIVYRIEE